MPGGAPLRHSCDDSNVHIFTDLTQILLKVLSNVVLKWVTNEIEVEEAELFELVNMCHMHSSRVLH